MTKVKNKINEIFFIHSFVRCNKVRFFPKNNILIWWKFKTKLNGFYIFLEFKDRVEICMLHSTLKFRFLSKFYRRNAALVNPFYNLYF